MVLNPTAMLLGLSVLAAGTVSVLAAGAGGPPAIDVKKSCQSSEKAVADIMGTNTVITVENCARQEQAARQEIVDNWAKYPASDRQLCVDTKAYMPSYVEWLTCLEMYRDVRSLRNAPKGQ
jgi:hypothetical protein